MLNTEWNIKLFGDQKVQLMFGGTDFFLIQNIRRKNRMISPYFGHWEISDLY